MRIRRPGHRVRPLEIVGVPAIELAAGAGHEVVDSLVCGMLEVMFMSVEHRAHTAPDKKRQQTLHPIGIVMIGTSTEGGMVTEGKPPARRLVGQQRVLHPLPVLWVL